MRCLIACEFSGTVRRAFRALGHDAWSCDLLPSEDGSQHHLQMDARHVLTGYRHFAPMGHVDEPWDLMIAHPPCTHLAVSGARWFKNKQAEQSRALEFVRMLMDAPIQRIALENPVSIISTHIRKPDQIIQPYQFGHEATKTTCLWLKNLAPLVHTNVVARGERHVTKSGKSLPAWYNLPPSETRWKERSRTFHGIAAAMAEQWGNIKTERLCA